LHLGFDLASWGMHRGSRFLLQHAYTVHLKAINAVADTRFASLWQREFGSEPADHERVPLVLDLSSARSRGGSGSAAASTTRS
jgi:hypothetical protein